MNSRSQILSKIKSSKPQFVELPKIDEELFNEDIDFLEEFKAEIGSVGGKVFSTNSYSDVLKQSKILYPDAKNNFSVLANSETFNTIDLNNIKKPQDLNDLDILILEGAFGVSENGAIWVSDDHLPIRVLPFIAKHLVLVLDKTKVFPYLHQAYKHLNDLDYDYGLFISGPSKTADIEQSLVIGAQGALSLHVFLV